MNDLIYNQTEIPKDQWRYGFRSSAAVGCGWIAVYNALRILGEPVEIEPLIRRLERQLPLIHGNTGTFAAAPALMLRHMGFPVSMTPRRSHFDEALREADVGILFYYWRHKWKVGAHFAAVRFENGLYYGYNTFRNSKGPDMLGPSLEAFVKRGGYFGCLLTTVKAKNDP